jgi:hypothetical protein
MKKYKLLIISVLLFNLSGVFAQTQSEPIEIKYGLGVYFTQNGKKLKPRELISITKINADALKEIQRAKINKEASQLFAIPGGFLVGWALGRAAITGEPKVILLGVGGAFIVASIPFSVAYSKRAKKGVNIYNEDLKQSDLGTLDFNFGLTQNGVGLKMTF